MKMRRRDFSKAIGGLVLCGPAVASCATSPGASNMPQITGPIAVTATSRPFLGAKERVEAAGYVEDEFFLAGKAHTYEWVGATREVTPIAGPGDYVTRILVRRPRDPARFSGNVEVCILNASIGFDFGAPADFNRMVAEGGAWIGITSKSTTAKALQTFDPERYAPLSWANPAPVAGRCAFPSIIPTYTFGGQAALEQFTRMGMKGSTPETEDGLAFDMLSQLAMVLKSERRHEILPGFSKPHLYMTGVSQSGLYIRAWVTAFHHRHRAPDGGPLYDGYLDVVCPLMGRINQCSADVPFEDPRHKIPTDLDVPFISLSSEGEIWMAKHSRQPDIIGPRAGLVSYEVAGGSHNGYEIPGRPMDLLGFPSQADAGKAGVQLPNFNATPPAGVNNFPWAPITRGAYENLQRWVREQVTPPQAPPIELDAAGMVVRDSYGNARGGLRTPYIDVPTAAHRGSTSDNGGPGAVVGTKRDFTSDELRALYPTHADYVTKFSASTDRILAARFISAEDAAVMKASAEAAHVPA